MVAHYVAKQAQYEARTGQELDEDGDEPAAAEDEEEPAENGGGAAETEQEVVRFEDQLSMSLGMSLGSFDAQLDSDSGDGEEMIVSVFGFDVGAGTTLDPGNDSNSEGLPPLGPAQLDGEGGGMDAGPLEEEGAETKDAAGIRVEEV